MRTKKEVEAAPEGPVFHHINKAATTTIADPSQPQKASRLPPALRFPLVVVLSFSLSSLGYSFLREWTDGELAKVARPLDGWAEIAVLAGWRICELALGWIANYDGVDLAALNLLSHAPTIYLIATFYGIRPTTACAALSIDVLSGLIPFLLLRRLSPAHLRTAAVPNRGILSDRTVQAGNTILVALIYVVTIFASLKIFLPGTLILYFNGISTIQPALDASLTRPPAALLSAALGIAAPLFIFTPSAATGRTAADAAIARFDPVDATLGETLWWTFWGYKSQTKVAVARTAAAVLLTGANTYVQLARTIVGVEPFGAAVYAAVWAFAALMAGVGLLFVGTA